MSYRDLDIGHLSDLVGTIWRMNFTIVFAWLLFVFLCWFPKTERFWSFSPPIYGFESNLIPNNIDVGVELHIRFISLHLLKVIFSPHIHKNAVQFCIISLFLWISLVLLVFFYFHNSTIIWWTVHRGNHVRLRCQNRKDLIFLTHVTILSCSNHSTHTVATYRCNKRRLRVFRHFFRFLEVIREKWIARSIWLRAVMKTYVLEVDIVELGRLFDLFIEEKCVVVWWLFSDWKHKRNEIDYPQIFMLSCIYLL